MKAAVYGPKVGYNSFEVVTRGFEEGLKALGVFGGRISPMHGDDGDYVSVCESEVGVCTGAYNLLSWMAVVGRHHKQRYVVLAPNSTWIPSAFWETIEACGGVDGVLAPSEWAKGVLLDSDPSGKVDVGVLPHGILGGFGPPSDDATPALRFNRDERFLIAHFAGSSLERKGTYELLAAFEKFRFRKESQLVLLITPMEWRALSEEVEARGMTGDVVVATRLNVPPGIMRSLYASCDVLCQPSRAEGFGLMPLEALACGTPVVMTVATGSTQYAVEGGKLLDGIVQVQTGPAAQVRYDPGGLAVEVSPDAIAEALEDAFSFHDVFKQKALAQSPKLLEKYAWKNVLKPFVRTMKEGKKLCPLI